MVLLSFNEFDELQDDLKVIWKIASIENTNNLKTASFTWEENKDISGKKIRKTGSQKCIMYKI